MKIIIIDPVHQNISEAFYAKNWSVDYHYESSKEEIQQIIHEYDGMVLRSRFKIDQPFLDSATSLKFIGRPGAGLENIDVNYCEAKGISVFRSPEGNRDAVAEHAIGMVLQLFNNLKRADLEVRDGKWIREGNRGYELMGKTFGIIGYGYMGKAIAKRLVGFGMRVITHDKYLQDYGDDFAKEVSLNELKDQADIISLHLPQSEENMGYFNSEFIASCKNPIYVINTSRGKSLVTKDLLEGIDSGKVLGACLDVLEFESSSFEGSAYQDEVYQKLVKSDKVVLSPHIAGWTHEAKFKMGDYLAKKIVNHFG